MKHFVGVRLEWTEVLSGIVSDRRNANSNFLLHVKECLVTKIFSGVIY